MDIDAAIPQQTPPDTSAILRSFVQEGNTDKASLQRMLDSDPEEFCRASITLLANAEPSTGYRYLVHLLLKHGLLIKSLADTENCRLEEAVTIVKSLTQIGSSVETELERRLSAMLQQPPSPAVSVRIHRLMELLSEISKNCFLLFQSELIAYSDPSVRASAVLLIGRVGKNADLMGRMLLDPDPRVQANAVEALSFLKEDACKPMLLTAAKSKHNRVAGNAVLGLYRISELRSISMLLDMAQNRDVEFRTSAIWAMGETGDPRFVPALTEIYKTCTGGERVESLRSLARIRNKTLARSANSPIEIRIARAETLPDQSRHLVLKFSSGQITEVPSLKPTDFAIWEGGALVHDFTVTTPNSSVLLATGFVVPRILSAVDPYRLAITDALSRTLPFKRPDDIWRIDRYTVEVQPGGAGAIRQASALPYDESVLGANVKTQHGFIASPDLLNKLISAVGARERSAADLLGGIDKVGEAIGKQSGKRHMFLFLHSNSTEWPVSEERQQQLADFLHNERIVLHAFATEAPEQWRGMRAVCSGTKGGTFSITSVEELPSVVEKRYSELVGRFEISYTIPAKGSAPGEGTLVLSSDLGCGQTVFSPTASSSADAGR